MAKFIELHDGKKRAILINIEDISLISEIYGSNTLTAVRMRDGSKFEALESVKTVYEKLKNIR